MNESDKIKWSGLPDSEREPRKQTLVSNYQEYMEAKLQGEVPVMDLVIDRPRKQWVMTKDKSNEPS